MDGSVSFGAWLKRRRKALDLTQAALAARVGVAPTTIEKIEAELRRPSTQTAQRLAEILEIAPGERQTFVGWARGEQRGDTVAALPVELASLNSAARAHRLPVALTSFVGREAELAELKALLEQPGVRLVTVTGAGGIGKTRLALAVAHALAPNFADGVCFVDLAPIDDPAAVTSTIAAACDVQPAAGEAIGERLRAYLAPKHYLLLLDNFEQLLAAAAWLSDLLTAAPALKILVTSRVVLRVSGEHTFQVPPLALPHGEAGLNVAELAASAAVRLFVERAQALRGSITAADLELVSEICRRVDGLPLAIELAAARTRLLPPAALLARMEQRLPLLTDGSRDVPARQQTVRNTIAWSFELLSPTEQRLFASLGVFAGGCSLPAAEAICGAPGANDVIVLERVTSLLDKSLLERQPSSDDEARVTMLETIREFAMECAQHAGMLSSLRERHARYYLDLALAAERHLRGAEQEYWCNRLDLEQHNLRAALSWFSEQHDIESALRLGAVLWWYWLLRGHQYDGCRQLMALLTLAGDHEVLNDNTRAALAMATLGAGCLSAQYDEMDDLGGRRARDYIESSISLFRQTDDRWGLACSLAFGALYQHWNDEAPGWADESRRLFEELGDHWGGALTLVCAARIEKWYENKAVADARNQFEQALRLFRGVHDTWGMSLALGELRAIAWNLGDVDAEERSVCERLALDRSRGDRASVAQSINQLADLMRWRGDYEQAVALYSESRALFRDLNFTTMLARSIHGFGYAQLWLGRPERAASSFAESLAMFEEVEHLNGIGWCFHGLAGAAAQAGSKGAALGARLLGAADILTDGVDYWPPSPKREYERVADASRSQLDAETWEALFAEGQAMLLADALDVAYQVIELAG